MQDETFQKQIIPSLNAENIYILKVEDLTDQQKGYLESYFDEQIFPVLTPMAVDAYRPFPMLLNKSINLAVNIEMRIYGYGRSPLSDCTSSFIIRKIY